MAISVKQKMKVGAWLLVAAVVASTPITVSAVASDSKSTTINATVNDVISMTTSSTVNLALTPTSSGAASSASDTITVNSNKTSGYNLTLSNADTVLSLASGANTINAHAGTFASPSPLATNSWGYRVDNAGTFGAGPTAAQTSQANLTGTWAGVPSSLAPQSLKSTAGIANSDVTTVWYGVKADSTKPSGIYTDSVTYTATNN